MTDFIGSLSTSRGSSLRDRALGVRVCDDRDDLVLRLRERLDEVSDQRDLALERLHEVMLQRDATVERLRVVRAQRLRKYAQHRARISELRASLAALNERAKQQPQNLKAARLRIEQLERELAGERAMRRSLNAQLAELRADGGVPQVGKGTGGLVGDGCLPAAVCPELSHRNTTEPRSNHLDGDSAAGLRKDEF
jgi:uncharacterized protein YhaN